MRNLRLRFEHFDARNPECSGPGRRTGEVQVGAFDDGDDGAQTIGKKDKERMLREVSKRWQWRMKWLSRLTWAAILVLVAWGVYIVTAFRVDPAVRLVRRSLAAPQEPGNTRACLARTPDGGD